MRWTCVVAMSLMTEALAGAGRPREAQEIAEGDRLYLFFSPSDRDLTALPAAVRRVLDDLEKRGMHVELRPVLLLEDFKTVGSLHMNEAFFNLVKELRDLRGPGFALGLYDEEGLAWAERFAIERTPAWALVRRDPKRRELRAHLVYGVHAKIEEVASCRKR